MSSTIILSGRLRLLLKAPSAEENNVSRVIFILRGAATRHEALHDKSKA